MSSKSIIKKQRSLGTDIQVVVCEYHQEVIQYIHRYIAKKKLPFSGLKMIHFDSHPDLAFPKDLNAEDCFNKEILYNDLDIADWILPLMYEGHLRDVIWIKPPWASQIDNLRTTFHVGKCKESGKLKVTCAEDYFIEDGIYAQLQRLENSKEVNLQVSTIETLLDDLDKIEKANNTEKYNSENNISRDHPSLCMNQKNNEIEDKRSYLPENNTNMDIIESNSVPCKKMKLDKHAIHDSSNLMPLNDEKFILDIDLDFFSVANPFLQDYSEKEYMELKKIYGLTLPTNKSDKVELDRFVNESQQKIDNLQHIIAEFKNGILTKDDNGLVEFLKAFKEDRPGKEIDWDLVHSAGLTTELPHHISSDEEIEELISKLETLIRRLPRPTMIIIARSAVDEYCPPDQVDRIEENVLEMLRGVYQNINVHLDYKDTSRLL